MRGVFSFVLLVTMAMAMVSGRMCVVTVARTARGMFPMIGLILYIKEEEIAKT